MSGPSLAAAPASACRLRPSLAARLQAGQRHPGPRRQRATLCFSNADGSVSVSFRLPYRCKFGQKLCLVGASSELGGWEVDRAVPMNWTEGDVWIVELQLPSDDARGAQLEYKYVVRSERDKRAVRWKEGSNCHLQLPAAGRLLVRDTWDDSMREVEVEMPGAGPAAAAAAAEAAVEPAPQAAVPRRGRPRKVDEAAAVLATMTKAADRAMQQLDAAVERSLDLLGNSSDPAAPELLAADRLLAAAAKRATTMNRALDAVKEAKALPTSSAAGPGSGKPRRRRAAADKGGDGSSDAGA